MMIRNLFVLEEGRGLILCSGILPEWLQTESPIRFGPTLTIFGKISIKIVQIDHKLAVSINAEHKHIPAQVEINLPGYQSLPVKNWRGVYHLNTIKDLTIMK